MARKLHMVERRHSNRQGQVTGGRARQAEQEPAACGEGLVLGGLAGVASGVSMGGEE